LRGRGPLWPDCWVWRSLAAVRSDWLLQAIDIEFGAAADRALALASRVDGADVDSPETRREGPVRVKVGHLVVWAKCIGLKCPEVNTLAALARQLHMNRTSLFRYPEVIEAWKEGRRLCGHLVEPPRPGFRTRPGEADAIVP
jgi:hypothetical protein